MPAFTQNGLSNQSGNLRNAGGANILASLQTNDGDTSYGYSLSGEGRAQYLNPTQLPAAAAAVTSATNANLSKEDGPGGSGVTLNWDGDSWNTGQALNTGYAYKSDSHDAARMTVALINSDYLGVWQVTAGGRGIRTTYIRRTGNYVAGSGGFLWLLQSYVPFLIGAGLSLCHMTALARTIYEAPMVWSHGKPICRSLIQPNEYAPALREWRAYTHPVYAF